MRSAYVASYVSVGSLRAINQTPEADLLRQSVADGRAQPLGSLASEIGQSYAKVLPRIDCAEPFGRELLSQVDIFAAEPRSRSIRADLIPFGENITIRRGDILIAGVGQIGEGTLFGRSMIGDMRLAGKLASGDVLIVRFDEPEGKLNNYTYAYLNSPTGLRAIRSCAYGTSIPRIRLDLLSGLPVPMPNEILLKRISGMISTAVKSMDAYFTKIREARQLIANLPEMNEAQALIDDTRRKCLLVSPPFRSLTAWNNVSVGRVPELLLNRWKLRIRDIAAKPGLYRPNRFTRIPCRYPHGTKLYSARDVFSLRPMAKRIKSSQPDVDLTENTLLIACSGSFEDGNLFGHVERAGHGFMDGVLTEHAARLVPKDEHAAVALAYLQTNVGFQLIRSAAYGTTIPGLRLDLVAEMPFPKLSDTLATRVRDLVMSASAARSSAAANEREAIRIVEEEVLPSWRS